MPDPAAVTWLTVFAVVFVGGVVKGVVGFGYALASTALLATIVPPSTAVVLVILPMFYPISHSSGNSTQLLVYSGLATVPGLLGVVVGTRVGRSLFEPVRVVGTLVLLSAIGFRLTPDGLRGP